MKVACCISFAYIDRRKGCKFLASSWRTASANGQVQDDDWEDENVAHADSETRSESVCIVF